jgi:hypothetical protein
VFIPVAMGTQSKLMKKPAAAGALKKSTVKKKPGAAAATMKLTPAAVATHEVTTQGRIDLLTEKMVAYKNGKLSECDFDHDDKHKLWDRFHKQLRKNDDASAAFESIEGEGKDAKKCKMLFAWIKDPSWGKAFANMTRPAVLLIVAVKMKAIHKPYGTL